MKPIKTLLVDDEFLALNLLEGFIQKVPDLEVIAKEKSPLKALEILNRGEVDLLFLDIQMPTLSGNNLLKTLKHPPVTIFTTAYENYAIEAFELNAVDYLLKPFSFERLLQAINKAKEQIRFREGAVPTSAIVVPQKSKDFFSVKVDGKIKKVNFGDILYIEGLKEYVRIVCEDERLVTLESLKNLEELLPEGGFLRVHKSYIVAKAKVQGLEGNMLEIGKQKIPISRSKREEVVKAIFYE
jgi:DNA-binding LytR/AlgR family response regulator